MVTGTGHKFTSLTLGLSMLAGLGVTLMIIALSVGVIEGANADSGTIGLLFVGGLALFVVGSAAWFGVTQPHKHFDDINVAMYHGHHEEHADAHAEPHAEEHAAAHDDHAAPRAH